MKFKNNGKVRKQEHKFYLESQSKILQMAKDAGFIVVQKIDLMNVAYDNQYLYVLQKA